MSNFGYRIDSFRLDGDNIPPKFARAGGVPERPKGPDCKSDGSAFVGSNPTPSTSSEFEMVTAEAYTYSGYCSVAEPQPSKLMARVRFPLPAPVKVYGKNWVAIETNAHIAQSVEHYLGKAEVIGSSPIVSTILE